MEVFIVFDTLSDTYFDSVRCIVLYCIVLCCAVLYDALLYVLSMRPPKDDLTV